MTWEVDKSKVKSKVTTHMHAGRQFSTWEGSHPSIQVNVLNELPHARYLLALERLRERIENGIPLVLDDSNGVGDKHTHASWGLCAGGACDPGPSKPYPDPEDHKFPLDFIKRGRESPLVTSSGCACPFDGRSSETASGWGCFYKCRIFRRRRGEGLPTRERALALYDAQITRAKAKG